MPFKKLASNKPAASTTVTLYTAPASSDVVATLYISNTGSSDETVNVYVADVGDSSEDSSNNIFPGATVSANSIVELSGIALYDGQFMEVKSSGGNVTFTLFGRV